MNTISIVILSVCFLIILIIVSIYNNLINKKNSVASSLSTIDVLLKKRHDLIPNLVSSVKQYLSHEQELFNNITKIREGLSDFTVKNQDRVYLENQLTSEITKFNLKVENYPELKANENILQLQNSLNEIEEQLSAGRKAYNACVLNLNNAIDMFPSNILAGMMKLKKRDFFEILDFEKKNTLIKELF